jgi:hypothetical protein
LKITGIEKRIDLNLHISVPADNINAILNAVETYSCCFEEKMVKNGQNKTEPIDRNPIDTFTGKFWFLSNFYPSPVKLGKITYPTAEHAYQAQKAKTFQERRVVSKLPSPAAARRYGRYQLKLRANWDEIKLSRMTIVLRAKFDPTVNPKLCDWLIKTGEAELIEGNYWHDTYWGVCKDKGFNLLGKLLEELRDALANNWPIVVNAYQERYDMQITRNTIWGNPFPINNQTSRVQSLIKCKRYFSKLVENDKQFRKELKALAGKRLGCVCFPQDCHGDIIVDLYKELIRREESCQK